MCFTLCEERELFERFERGYLPPSFVGTRPSPESHADLFGPFALAIDVPAARQVGILPATYYSPVDAKGQRFSAPGGKPGLHIQMIQKLKELRDVSIVLAHVERSLIVEGQQLPTGAMLKALEIELPYQPEIMEKLNQLPVTERRKVFELFNTDREAALNLVGFIDMMLSLFQETDQSFFDHTPLAFYQQREWRLIHHMREGTAWYCLGPQPHFRNSLAANRLDAVHELRRVIDDVGGVRREEAYFRSCWVLEEVDGTPVREFVSRLIVPARCSAATLETVRRFGCKAEVIEAEDFGYSAE